MLDLVLILTELILPANLKITPVSTGSLQRWEKRYTYDEIDKILNGNVLSAMEAIIGK